MTNPKKNPERNKRWKVTISENQAVAAPFKMLVLAYKACNERKDISVGIPLNFDTDKWRVFEGKGDPPKELMDLAYFRRR